MTVQKVLKTCAATAALALPCAVGAALGMTALQTRDYYYKHVRRARRLGFAERRIAVREGMEINIAQGPNGGVPLLLIPGQGSVWQEYAKVLPSLVDSYQVVIVDVHGHGGSTWNKADYTVARIASDLCVLLERIFGEEPTLVAGHSSGGLIAARLAAQHPERIRGVLFEDAPFFSTEPERVPGTYVGVDNYPSVQSFLAQNAERDWVCWYMPRSYWRKVFGGLWTHFTREVTRQRRARPDRLPVIRWVPVSINRIWESMSHPFDLRFSAAFVDGSWFAGFDQEQALAAVRCPTSFLKASTRYDSSGILLAALSESDLERIEDLLDDNTTVRIDGPHDLHFAHTSEYVKALRELAKRATAP